MKTKSDVRSSCWSITINNPTEVDEEHIAKARQKGWKVEGQKEVGKNGTPHYQLLVESGQVRFVAVQKAFPRAHIEVCRDKVALKNYVHKAETKVEELETTTEQYPSQQKVWDMFAVYMYEKYDDGKDHSVGLEELNGDEWLFQFDQFVTEFIRDGYVLEGIAVNPQVRSGLKKYGYAIYLRSKSRNFGGYIRRQTDSQTDTTSEVADNISIVDIPEDAKLSSCGTSTSEEGTWTTEGQSQ
nr:MAG: replication associated protein [Cressdnaviricota sp.]